MTGLLSWAVALALWGCVCALTRLLAGITPDLRCPDLEDLGAEDGGQ